jgi:S-formylglutathione hydrolase
MNSSLEYISKIRCFDGWLQRISHFSEITKCKMTFSIYLPPQSEKRKLPVIWFLSGLTCNDENFFIKSGAQRFAALKGIILIAPDTSPRGINIPGDSDHWDFGVGASFYLDATESKWKTNYNMYSYITKELPELIIKNFPVIEDKQSIMGHSMGGHGALICSLKNPGKYKVFFFFYINDFLECFSICSYK